ncbi:helix-turn-helix transcriptional regulator [Ornithinibacillus sp. BX22]|uniref:Helix-turn-helix transcriptional regulator n=2 Tax=Ornithinibacillus TaxID=484508 RepID=A0A923L8C3_9BACI|nr:MULTISPECIES: helix-turn-helix transcriptional regulator [Ornithinibacillus]MBC5638433.1 helix-turn-helix transcriptional regulator [Ornithinibacillus hominis]MBS3678593.1 helix-turn-helix transcriptional regulator [Ornithinibacillus massiliensis]
MEKGRIGRRIKAFRKLKGYTQVRLAKELNISLNTLGKIERGTREVSEKLIQQIAETLNIDIEELTGRKEE